jgi:ferritin-like metal-binding protein YciE
LISNWLLRSRITRRSKLGSDRSTSKDLARRFVGIAQAYAGAISLDEPVKDCLAAYASIHLQIATYVSLRAAALELAEPEIVRCATNICNKSEPWPDGSSRRLRR